MFKPNPNSEDLCKINEMIDKGATSAEISKVVEVVEDSVKRFMEERKKKKTPVKKVMKIPIVASIDDDDEYDEEDE